MGFLDKAKEQAEKLAKSGQDKLEEVQSKKKADGLLRDLGAWYYASKTDRDHGKGDTEMARITAELKAHEAEFGPLDNDDPSPSAPEAAESAGVHAVPSSGVVVPPPPPPGMGSPDAAAEKPAPGGSPAVDGGSGLGGL